MEKTNTLLTGLLLRLAVELESECIAAVEAGGDVLDVPLTWLDTHGFGWLNPHQKNDLTDEKCRPRAVSEFDPATLNKTAKILRNALYVADEVEQLDGETALDFVAGWIGGATLMYYKMNPEFYLSVCVDFTPLHRDVFNKGYAMGEADAHNRREQRRRREREATEVDGGHHESV